MSTQTAIFAAGCFWGVEDTFRAVEGVLDAEVGYTGGHTETVNYEMLCRKGTGHAEAVKVTFDDTKVGYADLLRVFFESHDPTTPNRQGPDIGDQYRSAIFYTSPEQEAEARASIERFQPYFKRPIVTQIVPEATWHRGEEYHQQYHAKHGGGCKLW
jgi:peptide-methionine (S)-S-oxide reductase